MKLENFEIHNSDDKRIICFGRSYNYINAFIEKYDVLNSIDFICDNNPKTWGKTKIGDRSIPVKDPGVLESMDLRKYIIVITSAFYNEIFAQIESIPNVISQMTSVFQYSNQQFENERFFREKYAKTELEDLILFRSGPLESACINGLDFSDNSKALFEYLIKNGYDRKYRIVWFVSNPNRYSKDYLEYNVSFVPFEYAWSEKGAEAEVYYSSLFLAKYIFFTDAHSFAKLARKDQIRVQLWHGCGFKTRTNFSRCEDRYEYTTVVSQMYSEIHQKIYGLREDQMLITGYAKQDWLFEPYDRELSDLLNCPKASKYVFWLPTFRMADDKLKELNAYEINPQTGLPIVEDYDDMKQLNDLLVSENIVLIVKLHPVQNAESVKTFNLSNIRILPHNSIDDKGLIINRLLASADALISDYSSAAVDFLNLDRPIGFTLDDVDDYKSSRGFVFDDITEWLPGTEIYNVSDFRQFILEIAKNMDSSAEKRHKVALKMLKYRDCNNRKRIIESLGITK